MSNSTCTRTYHVNVFNFEGGTERDFTFDSEFIADAFVRGLDNCAQYMVMYHESMTFPSGRTHWTELVSD